MKQNVFLKIWDVIYPIFIYYVVSNVVIYLAALALGIDEGSYVSQYTLLQTIATAVCLPVLYGYYRRDKLICSVFQQRMTNEFAEIKRNSKILNFVLTFICGSAAGLGLNHLIGATNLARLSLGYQEVTAHFFAGGIFIEILGIGILIPLVEELLYRGIVYGRLSDWIGVPGGAVVSSLIFAGLHLNLVQFIYAFFMGLLLVYLLEKTHHLLGAVLGHMGANLLTVLRTETGFLGWMEKNHALYWISTAVMALICLVIILYFKRKVQD